jgi:hypothetical protein
MKFYLITAMAVILFAGTITSQHINFGIKGGLNLYNIRHTCVH